MPLSAHLATLHAAVFDGPSRWSQAAFASALEDPRCFFSFDGEISDAPPDGFILGRTVSDEAELLTLAVSRSRRRQGLGRALLEQFETKASLRGAVAAFLEVSADNKPARALYEQAGWRTVGQRTGYYEGVDALAMRKDL